MYVIVKQVNIGKDNDGTDIVRPVILIDSHSEIMEFDNLRDAMEFKSIFEKNSTHGSVYEVKEV